MDLTVRDKVYGADNRSWLGSQHGTESCASITLDVEKFEASKHYPKGEIASGTVLGKVTATGLYGPYDNSANDGRETAAGHLFSAAPVAPGAKRLGAPLLDHGAVVVKSLPTNHGLDEAAQADLAGQIRYR